MACLLSATTLMASWVLISISIDYTTYNQRCKREVTCIRDSNERLEIDPLHRAKVIVAPSNPHLAYLGYLHKGLIQDNAQQHTVGTLDETNRVIYRTPQICGEARYYTQLCYDRCFCHTLKKVTFLLRIFVLLMWQT